MVGIEYTTFSDALGCHHQKVEVAASALPTELHIPIRRFPTFICQLTKNDVLMPKTLHIVSYTVAVCQKGK